PRKAGDKCRGKGGQDKEDQVDGIKLTHHAPHQVRRGYAAAAIGQRLACYSLGVVADDLAESSCARPALSTTKFPIADPSQSAYIGVSGLVKQAPRQTVLRPSSAPLAKRGVRDNGRRPLHFQRMIFTSAAVLLDGKVWFTV